MNIYGAAKKIPQDEIDKEIILLVNNDEDVKKVKEGAKRQYIAEEASKVFGKSTMIASLRKLYDFASSIKRPVTEQSLRKLFEEKKQEEFGGMELMEDRKIEPLNLLLHQRMTVKYIADAVRSYRKNPTKNNRFLIGILPRGGKTFIAGGLISELQANNIVVLLGAKSETQSQFIGELFYKYLNFNDYKIINVKDEKDPELQKGDLDKNSKHIFVMSIELFKMEEVGNRPLLQLLRGLLPGKKSPVDLIISDEAHLKQVTKKSEKAIAEALEAAYEIDDSLDDNTFKSIPIVYMTGTFRKPKSAFNIPDSHTMIWDYKDVQKAKLLDENVEYFTNSFGSYFTESYQHLLLSSSIEDIKSTYQSFPEIHLMETHFFPGVEDKLLTQSDEKGIPDMSKIFIINKGHNFKNPSEWHLGFQFNKQMRRIINFLGPDEDQVNTGDDKMTSVLTSIDRIAQRTGDRLRMFSTDFVVHSQLWFLPSMIGNPLSKRMMALAGTIFQHPWFREHFNVYSVCGVDWKEELTGVNHVETGSIDINVGNSKGRFQYYIPSKKSLKESVLDAEEKARKLGKGLIILAQNMLQLGISLPCVSIVVLLDTGKDVDERIQKMYRALTQSPQKKDAFIVDLDYFRTISAIAEYNIQAFQVRNKRPPQKEDREKIYNDIFNIYSFNDDTDMFATKHLKADQIEEIMKKMDEKEYRPPTDLKDGGQLMNQNVNATVEINAQFLDFVNPHTEKKSKKQQEEYIKKIEQRLKKAKPIKEDDKSNEGSERNTESEDSEGNDSDANAEDNNDTAKMDKITREEAYRDIFKTLLRYGVFATENKSLESLKNDIAHNSDTQDKIYDLLIKRGIIKSSLQKETLINQIILPNLNKFLAKEKEGSFEGMRSYVNDESKYPDQVQQVLSYINDHLAPKDKERKEYGEIYTPLSLVNEMLDKLPEGVWSNPNLKWLDPANGMGNFPILAFLRLCKGLKGKVKDHVKHIVENMLFMIDINGKNNDVARNLFKKLAPDATPNIEKIDDEKGFFAKKPLVFNKKTVTGFDIIMGNPPYNTPKTGSGTGTGNSIWPNFVVKSHSILNDEGYILFVHPPGWKKPTNDVFKPERFADGDYTHQVIQGLVWPLLKDSGTFQFIYTNDQKSKELTKEYIDYFPAVDYYLYQKGGLKTSCDTKNVFLGTIEAPKGVRLNYNLKYLPNLITKQTQDILHKITSKEGGKPNFGRYRDDTGFSVDSAKGKYKYIYTYNKESEPKFQYSDKRGENIDLDKVIMNFDGGIDCFTVQYIKKEKEIGSYDKTMYSKVESDKEGLRVEKFFKSDIVKFIFLITQYASGQRTQNEPLVANSITIPPEGTVDYYKFFDIEQYKEYIEEILAHYEKFKAPKRKGKTLKANNKNVVKKQRRTRKAKRT